MKRMLFNATQAEELRVAIVDGQKLIDIDIESAGRESRKSNIYKGTVTRVEPSLEACFVNYGEERHGFLPFKEISRSFFRDGVDASKARIQDAIAEGAELIVQVDKEERGNKGAALTTYISLAGRYLVLMPNNPRGGGVSRRIEGEERQELREAMDKLEHPGGMSLIARTAGIGRTTEELQWDLDYLLQLWGAIEGAAGSAPGPFLIYQESSLVIRAIRDYFSPDIGEILIDTDDIYEQAHQFMAHVMPDMEHRVKRYQDDTPLYSRFQIEHQIETAYSRIVPLPSGGAIVIDHTEALVAIDVNSARATKGADIEETALRTNLEAADEAARQMRLRDLGGLIVIDFIDMENSRNQREVEQRLKEALHYDRARVQAGKISRFGLMELSRQRLRPALNEGTHITCPRCNGTGVIRDVESAALHVLRVIQEEAMKENTAVIHAQVPVDVATYLLNEKRSEIAKLEARLKVEIVLIPNKFIETPHYRLERLRHDDDRLATYRASYTISDGPPQDNPYLADKLEASKPRQEAVVKGIVPDSPAPVRPPAPAAQATPPAAAQPATSLPVAAGQITGGLIGRILNWLSGKAANEAQATAPAALPAPAGSTGSTSTESGSGSRSRGGSRRGDGRRNGRQDGARAATGTDSGRSRSRRSERIGRDDEQSREAGTPRSTEAAPAAEGSEGPREATRPRSRRGRRGSGEGRDSRPQAEEARETDIATAEAATATAAVALAATSDAAAPGAGSRDIGDEGSMAAEATTGETTTPPVEGEAEEGQRRRPRRRRGRRSRSEGDTQDAAAESGAEATGSVNEDAPATEAVEVERARDAAAEPAPITEEAAIPAEAVAEVPAQAPADIPADVPAEPAASMPPTDAEASVTSLAAEGTEPTVAALPVEDAGPAVEAHPAETTEAAPVAHDDAPVTSEPAVAEPEAAIEVPAVVEALHATETHPAGQEDAAGSRIESAAAGIAEITPISPPEPAGPDLDAMIASAGLQMVETSPDAVHAEPEPIVIEPRRPRKRRPAPPVFDGPMQQVETHAERDA